MLFFNKRIIVRIITLFCDLENLVILWRTGGVKIPQARPPEGWVGSNEGKICLGELVMAVISLEKPVKRR